MCIYMYAVVHLPPPPPPVCGWEMNNEIALQLKKIFFQAIWTSFHKDELKFLFGFILINVELKPLWTSASGFKPDSTIAAFC